MTTNTIVYRYAEDYTGNNQDNYVSGEKAQLNTGKRIRAYVPKYGPFFTKKNFTIFDLADSRPLVLNVDYAIPIISQELTLRTGEEIADSLLVINSAVSDNLSISYQSVGGPYQNQTENLANILEAFLSDSRAVDWITGVFNKPSSFPPPPHAHWLSEIFGWEPVAFELERIAQAISLGQAPAMDALYQALFGQIISSAEIQAVHPLRKFMTHERMLEAAKLYNFNSIQLTPSANNLEEGDSFEIGFRSTNISDGTTLFWTIEHETTNKDDFVYNTGIFTVNAHKAVIPIQLTFKNTAETEEKFRVAIRANGPTGEILATTELLKIKGHTISLANLLSIMYRNRENFLSPAIPRSGKTAFIWWSMNNVPNS